MADRDGGRSHLAFVGKCWVGAARYISTVCLRGGAQVWSGNARLQRRGISRPFFSGTAYKNGRDLPGCCTEANHDRFWVR